MAVPHPPRPMSPSPPPPPQNNSTTTTQPTKRDLRRTRIADRLQNMIDTFSTHQHAHYRAQLQAVQVDMTLVLRADPYDAQPLMDSGEDVGALVEGMLSAASMGDEGAQRDYLALAGKRYGEFAAEVNDELEKRDADLTALHNSYHSSIAALDRLTQQKLHQAEEEHKALSSTIRNRLHTTITKKRQVLLRDKDQLDIGDANALLLHPNQFSINNPSSPGGIAGQNWKTRHLRHRAASPGAGDLGENGKRKRKLAVLEGEDAGNESSAPAHPVFRAPLPDSLGGGRSPFKDARKENGYTQFEAPAYSLERIFTDKELALASATAQQATYRHFNQPQLGTTAQPTQADGAAASTTADTSVDGEILPDPGLDGDETTGGIRATTEAGGGATGTPPPASAPEMDRTASQQTHQHQVLTRGTLRANPLAALSDLANVAAAAASSSSASGLNLLGLAAQRENPFAPVLPAYTAIARSEKSGAPAPAGVGIVDVEGDLEMIRRAGAASTSSTSASQQDGALLDAGLDQNTTAAAAAAAEDSARTLRTQLLDQALGTPSTGLPPFRPALSDLGPATVGPRVERPAAWGFAQLQGITSGDQLNGSGNGNGKGRVEGALTGFGGQLPRSLGGSVVGGSLAAVLGAGGVGGGGGEGMSRVSSAQGSELGGEVSVPGSGSGRRRRRGGGAAMM
ncbi:hypothetical protein LTR78_006802 [Recurvomyces mirabilis]|uniref:Uncharacterized protein n=1 Tax=Recurvomyces mirabilis TaxID=574656 RepID=A0AAE0WK91_9PEZI|nr:hypothetical protein LTR78_006802 [Recurvomyces mirabilis]KAK5153208.1 hypothetical protein LTS14_007853 [Recurvomyces mirabilis]